VNLSITAAFLIESEKEEKERIMEALVFALIAVRNGYFVQETIVPEPAEFQPFDLRALKRSYDAEDDSSGRPSDRRKSLVAQVAS
jgi:hypothetical protein